MASEKKKVEKKQETPQKGKAFVDTSNSKVVKGSNKAEVEQDKKAVVEKNNNTEMENNNQEFEQSILDALNEALSNKTMKADEVNKWLSENNLKDVVAKLESEDGKYNVDDIIKLISDQERKELQSEVVTNLKLDESATEEDIELDDEDAKEEKDSSNTPEPKAVSENIEEETESSTDDIEFDEDDSVNEEELPTDGLDEFREMARTSESLESFINAIRSKNDVPAEVSTAFFEKYGQDNRTPEQAAEVLYNEVKDSMNENIHQNMKRLIHLNSLKESANELVNKFGLTDIEKIKESLVEELTDKEYEIVLEDVYIALNIEVNNDYNDETESLNESLRSDLHDKLI